MAKKGIVTTLAGLAIAGAAVGGAVAYLKKCKRVNDFAEEDFDDLYYLDEEDSSCGCGPERTYTTLPTENAAAKEHTAKAEQETPQEAEAEEAEADGEETDGEMAEGNASDAEAEASAEKE